MLFLRLKKYLISAVIFTILISACSSPSPSQQQSAEPKSTAPAGGSASIEILLEKNEQSSGETFEVKVLAKGISDLTAFETHLSFDKNVLEVVEIRDGGFISPDFSVQNTYDNAAGTIDYAVAQINREAVSGEGTLLIIIFGAKSQGSSDISFRSTPAAPDGVLLANSKGLAIPAVLTHAKVIIK